MIRPSCRSAFKCSNDYKPHLFLSVHGERWVSISTMSLCFERAHQYLFYNVIGHESLIQWETSFFLSIFDHCAIAGFYMCFEHGRKQGTLQQNWATQSSWVLPVTDLTFVPLPRNKRPHSPNGSTWICINNFAGAILLGTWFEPWKGGCIFVAVNIATSLP